MKNKILLYSLLFIALISTIELTKRGYAWLAVLIWLFFILLWFSAGMSPVQYRIHTNQLAAK